MVIQIKPRITFEWVEAIAPERVPSQSVGELDEQAQLMVFSKSKKTPPSIRTTGIIVTSKTTPYLT
ncbi:hypothetical protein N7466_001228 [Penicillium verhagenii]|uniref:uncharacterized protein n=1 Tax=Penicillium verhagenii TaxID=1562060 RepID=UPI0025452875|nr:uncharacterized protein N7466_001228 [Penicillium verhagenii]KAJ5948213.1 hypothetical protein N7466_001228 [Penicillium verhagenii]